MTQSVIAEDKSRYRERSVSVVSTILGILILGISVASTILGISILGISVVSTHETTPQWRCSNSAPPTPDTTPVPLIASAAT